MKINIFAAILTVSITVSFPRVGVVGNSQILQDIRNSVDTVSDSCEQSNIVEADSACPGMKNLVLTQKLLSVPHQVAIMQFLERFKQREWHKVVYIGTDSVYAENLGISTKTCQIGDTKCLSENIEPGKTIIFAGDTVGTSRDIKDYWFSFVRQISRETGSPVLTRSTVFFREMGMSTMLVKSDNDAIVDALANYTSDIEYNGDASWVPVLSTIVEINESEADRAGLWDR